MLTLSTDVTTFEYICSRVKSNNSVILLVAIYRPGSKAVTRRFFSELTELLEHFATHRCPVVLTGYFNVKVDRPKDKHALLELLASFDMLGLMHSA